MIAMRETVRRVAPHAAPSSLCGTRSFYRLRHTRSIAKVPIQAKTGLEWATRSRAEPGTAS